MPTRLDAAATAKLLGFAEHDVQALMAAGKLEPLGDPAPNALKRFAAIEVIRLAAACNWLTRATRRVCRHWRHKRERRAKRQPAELPDWQHHQTAGTHQPQKRRRPKAGFKHA
ncbi:MAG: hypothetical protein ACLQU3_19195 [Limisphaerales bacterium]